MKIVLKLSGKLITPEDSDYIKNVADVIRYLAGAKGHRIAVVVGGGPIARKYIAACRDMGLSESHCDILGVMVTRLNASLLIYALEGLAHPTVPKSAEEFISLWDLGDKIVVSGGFQPAQSTAAVSSILAELINADILILATVVDGIYDRDPYKDPSAKKIKYIKASELRKLLINDQKNVAGGYELIDQISLNIIERSKLKAVVINGKDPQNILRVIEGQNIGSWIYG